MKRLMINMSLKFLKYIVICISFNAPSYLCPQSTLTKMQQEVKFLPKRFSLKCSIRGQNPICFP